MNEYGLHMAIVPTILPPHINRRPIHNFLHRSPVMSQSLREQRCIRMQRLLHPKRGIPPNLLQSVISTPRPPWPHKCLDLAVHKPDFLHKSQECGWVVEGSVGDYAGGSCHVAPRLEVRGGSVRFCADLATPENVIDKFLHFDETIWLNMSIWC